MGNKQRKQLALIKFIKLHCLGHSIESIRQFNFKKSENPAHETTFYFRTKVFLFHSCDFYFRCKHMWETMESFHGFILFVESRRDGLRKRWMEVVFGFVSSTSFLAWLYTMDLTLLFSHATYINSQIMRSRNLSLHRFLCSMWWDIRQNALTSYSCCAQCIYFHFLCSSVCEFVANVGNFTT